MSISEETYAPGTRIVEPEAAFKKPVFYRNQDVSKTERMQLRTSGSYTDLPYLDASRVGVKQRKQSVENYRGRDSELKKYNIVISGHT